MSEKHPRLHVVKNDIQPVAAPHGGVWVEYFHPEYGDLRDSVEDSIKDSSYQVYSERFWVFAQNAAAKAVGTLILGVAAADPRDLGGIGSITRSDVAEGAETTTLIIVADIDRNRRFAEVTVDNLIEVTNEQLAGLESPYALPFE
jgi:hypothetical protein